MISSEPHSPPSLSPFTSLPLFFLMTTDPLPSFPAPSPTTDSSDYYRARTLSMAGENGTPRRLRERLGKAADVCSTKASAMAYGYLLAQDDMAKGLPSLTAPAIDDMVEAAIQAFSNGEQSLSDTLQIVFGLIYKWVDDAYDREEYESDGGARECLADIFRPYVRPGVVVDEVGLVNPAAADNQAPTVNSFAVAKADPWYETVRHFLEVNKIANRAPLTSNDIYRAIDQLPPPNGAFERICCIANACGWSVVTSNGAAKFWPWLSSRNQ